MIQNNFTVLPFYSDLKYQHSNKPYAFGAIYPLYASAKSLLPFQFTVNHVADTAIAENDGELIKKILLVNIDTGLSTSISSLVSDFIYRKVYSTSDCVYYAADTVFDRNLAQGQYYIYIQFADDQEVYSEVITVVDNIEDYLKIIWWDKEDLEFDSGFIAYNSIGFKNVLYLNTDIGKPDYKFEEDGKERDGYFFAEKQLSEKVYRFTFVAPEYLCDAVRFIRLSDNVHVYKNGIDYIVDSFLANVAWQEQGDLAAVDVEFRTNTVVKKIAAAWPK